MTWAKIKDWLWEYDTVVFLGFVAFGWLFLWIIYVMFAVIFF